MKRIIGFSAGAVFVVLLVVGLRWAISNFTVELPTYTATTNTVFLAQNWTPEQRNWFHIADQGTQTFGIPYEWFVALEQPALSFGTPGLLTDPTYLDRYGFISIPSGPDKTTLPIGFARGESMMGPTGPWQNPATHKPQTSVGLTCAACHTGRFDYKNTTVVVEGGPALIDLANFQKGVALSLLYTRYVPGRFDRFADRVLGSGASDDAKAALKSELSGIVSQVKAVSTMESKVKSTTVQEGYARLDALNRIGNTVFAIDELDTPGFNAANFSGFSAPVHYPRIWNASWLQWVQYNGSIQQPMTRNAGEALGVLSQVSLTGDPATLYASTVKVDQLYAIEQLLAGKPPTNIPLGFKGLDSPQWPEFLPAIDKDKAAKGAVLYKEICQGCHMVPLSDPAYWTQKRWSATNAAGESYMDLTQIPITEVGTDSAQAADMAARKIITPANLGITKDDFGDALAQFVDKTVTYWYKQHGTSPADQERMNGNRTADVRAPLSYKVRSLNGIWATPPYLHNGSVPSLYALLSPVSERPTTFYLGNREYDPIHCGYSIDALRGGFKFDTSIRGNSNTGHEFATGTKDAGVIGRGLSPEERMELIEYLKTL